MSRLEKVRPEIAKYDYIRFALCDLNGVSRGHVVPTRNAAKYIEDGLDMYEGVLVSQMMRRPMSIDHEKSCGNGNLTLLPDLSTLRPIPWSDFQGAKFAEVLCESFWKKDKSPQEACPRYVLRKQLKRLDDLGLEIYSGFEVEYLALSANSMTPVTSGQDFTSHRIHNRHGNFLVHVDQQLLLSGVEIERFHAEDSEGMFEIVLKPKYGVESADATFNCKQGLLEIGDLNDRRITFMTKATENYVGTGCHFNFSLISKERGTNVFYDDKERDKLSVLAKQWIAGVLKHSKALTALQCPTINCYRRLHGPWSPSSIYWAMDDRDSCIRVKNNGTPSTYMENRLPSGKSNPYIVMASTIAAGLDGILNNLVCPPSGKRANAETLPKSLSTALRELEEDVDLVTALGSEFVSWFVANKSLDFKTFETVQDDRKMINIEREYYF